MLDNLRANKGGIITYVFLGAIIVVFVVSFGPGSFDKGCNAQGGAWAAKVNGETIDATEYARIYNNELRQFQQQAGQAFTREMAEQLGLGRMALDKVVNRALLIQEAHRQGLVISDAELAKTIAEMPGLSADGKFDRDGYDKYVTANYGSANRFEKELREELLQRRLLAGVRQTVKVSDDEIRQAWTAEHDQVVLSFVRFPQPAAEAEVKKPTDAEAAAFAAREPARVEAAYKEQAARFDQPRKIRARHIVAKVAPGASPEDEGKAKVRLEALAARAAKGEDFAKLAAEASEDDNTKARGGDLGVISEGLVDKTFAEAAFALPKGGVSAPIRTAAGWSLVKVEETFPARKVTLEQARPELARELLLKERAKAMLAEKATAALAAVKAGKTLADLFPTADAAAKKKAQPVKIGAAVVAAETTGSFGADSPFIPRLGAAPELAAAALAGTAGKALDKVFETPQGPVVAVVEKRERPDPAQFEAQKEGVAERLRARKEGMVLPTWVKGLRDAADVKVNPSVTGAATPVEG